MAEPTDAELRVMIGNLVKKVDLDETSPKKFIALLSKQLGGLDLTRKKKFIKDTVREAIEAMQEEEEEEEESSSEEEEEKPKKMAKRGAGGLAAQKEISDELSSFLGKGKKMARTEIVKELWNHIRSNDLQNPKDKREIILDDAMQKVFGVKRFTMFSMNKHISAHIHPFNPVDLSSSKKKEPKKRKAAAKKKKNGEKKTRRSGTQAPWQLSPELVRIVGKQILPRPQVTQGLWAYIREHKLQNPTDKREIICDDKLKAVMGGKSKVTMFNMNKYITPHMLEKLDKSYYTHEEEEQEGEKKQVNEEESETEEEVDSDDVSDGDNG